MCDLITKAHDKWGESVERLEALLDVEQGEGYQARVDEALREIAKWRTVCYALQELRQ